jgi:hypothetical protein
VRRLSLLLAVAALLVAACGGEQSPSADAQESLSGALEELRASKGLTVDLSLRSTPESLQALTAEDGGSIAAEDAQKVLDSSLRISSAMKARGVPGATEIVLTVAGREGLELRSVGKSLYVRADVRHLLESFGQDPAVAARFVQQAAASGLDFVGPLVDGRWIALEGFEEAMGHAGGQPAPTAEQKKVLDDLVASFERATTVTSEGSDDVGEHLVASVSLRDVYEDLEGIASELAPTTPGGLPSAGEVPDERVRIDLWVTDGRLTQVEFDFLQLRDLGDAQIPEGVAELALRIRLEDFSGEVDVPADAVPVHLQEVMQSLFGMAAGTKPASGGL